MSNLSHRAVAIVSHCVNQERHPTRAIALVGDFFIVDTFFRAGAAADRAIDRVVGHVAGFGVGNGFTQPRVRVRITAAGASGNRDFLDKFSEELAALRVSRALLVLNRVPLGMSGHLR